jgi:hypothetical protein
MEDADAGKDFHETVNAEPEESKGFIRKAEKDRDNTFQEIVKDGEPCEEKDFLVVLRHRDSYFKRFFGGHRFGNIGKKREKGKFFMK